jgi:hypothetical protein
VVVVLVLLVLLLVKQHQRQPALTTRMIATGHHTAGLVPHQAQLLQ